MIIQIPGLSNISFRFKRTNKFVQHRERELLIEMNEKKYGKVFIIKHEKMRNIMKVEATHIFTPEMIIQIPELSNISLNFKKGKS